ncbi:hypothetical protein M422DRAFT_245473 [Sphaerobolus stellatus SS14]|nr:hypothetical protein M422DRAFT_245473 [Sphaerobolus stellatus SS14]
MRITPWGSLYPSSSSTWTTSSSSTRLYTARSGIFTGAFTCPTTMTTTATTTVIKDEASVKNDCGVGCLKGSSVRKRKTWFGRKADDYLILGRTMASLASIQATRFVEGVLVLCLKACGRRFHGWYGAHQDCFVGNQPLDGAPVGVDPTRAYRTLTGTPGVPQVHCFAKRSLQYARHQSLRHVRQQAYIR